jgi:hypothetical protein
LAQTDSLLKLTRDDIVQLSSQQFEEYVRQLTAQRELTPEERKEFKRQRRLIKNRESAQASRIRKKKYIETLEAQVTTLATENTNLKERITSLTSENAKLKEEVRAAFILSSHHTTPHHTTPHHLLFVFRIVDPMFIHGVYEHDIPNVDIGYVLERSHQENSWTFSIIEFQSSSVVLVRKGTGTRTGTGTE